MDAKFGHKRKDVKILQTALLKQKEVEVTQSRLIRFGITSQVLVEVLVGCGCLMMRNIEDAPGYKDVKQIVRKS